MKSKKLFYQMEQKNIKIKMGNYIEKMDLLLKLLILIL